MRVAVGQCEIGNDRGACLNNNLTLYNLAILKTAFHNANQILPEEQLSPYIKCIEQQKHKLRVHTANFETDNVRKTDHFVFKSIVSLKLTESK